MTRIQLPGDVGAKVRRAEHHLQDLDALLSNMTKATSAMAEPVFQTLSGSGGAWGAKLRIQGVVPDEVPLIVGDFLHNLRSSLDYLAQALVQTSGNSPVDGIGGTTFPILDKPKRHGQLQIKGTVTPEIGLAIEAVQPYKVDEAAVSWHPLHLLHELSNKDKHRRLQFPLVTTVNPVAMLVGHLPQKPVGLIQSTLRSFSDGEWLFHPFAPFPPDVRVDVIATIRPPMVALADVFAYPDGSIISLIDMLDYMLRTVRDMVVPSFRPYFMGPWPEDMFLADPVPGPLGVPQMSAEHHLILIDGMISTLASEYESDRYLVLSLMEGVSA